jgi:hypothetical protein
MSAAVPEPAVPLLDPDGPRSQVLASMTEHLTGPLAAGAVTEDWPLDAAGQARVTWARQPLVLLRLEQDLSLDALDVLVSATGIGSGPPPAPGTGGPGVVTGALVFAPFSERGACLPVWPLTGQPAAPDLWLKLAAAWLSSGGGRVTVPKAGLAGLLTPVLVQGTLGALQYLMAAEKASLRAAAREVSSVRLLALARSGSLDRHGADLSIPRFTDRLVTEPGPPPQISTGPRTEPDGLEPDADYRRRLASMRQWAVPTRAGALEAVNGPGAPADPPAGWLAGLGGTERIALAEETSPFVVGMRVISSAGPDARLAFLDGLRRDRLVWPLPSAGATAAYAARLLTAAQRADLDALGQLLRDGFAFSGQAAADPALAPGLARALALVARCRTELRIAGQLVVRRAQDPDGGNRYELGFGADLQLPKAAQAEAARQAALAWRPGAKTPRDLAGILAAAAQAAAAGPDPQLNWLLAACGLRSVVPVSAGALYVSHLPVAGLDIAGPGEAPAGGWSHIAALSASLSGELPEVVRYSRAARRAELLSVLPSGAEQIRAQLTAMPPFDVIVTVPGRHPVTPDLVLGYDRPAGTGLLYLTERGSLLPLRTLRGWRTSWSLIVAGRFGGQTRYGDLIFFERATGTFEMHSVTESGGLVPAGSPGPAGGGAPGTLTFGGWGRWSHLVRWPEDPNGTGSDDAIVCYDAASGDLQFLESDAASGLRVRWYLAGWQPGLSHLVAGTFTAAKVTRGQHPQLLGYDRERGTITVYSSVASGTPLPVRRCTLGPRALTQLAVIGQPIGFTSSRGDNPALLGYDRAGGRSGLWRSPLPDGALPAPGRPWGGSPAVTLTATLTSGPGDPQSQSHAVLAEALAAAAAAWAADGQPAWQVVTDPAAQLALWQQAGDPGAAGPVLAEAGLPAVAASFAESAAALPAQYVATLVLDAGQAARWHGGQGGDEVTELMQVLSAGGLASAAAIVTGAGAVAVTVSVTGLPGVGLTLASRRTAGYRWYALPMRGLAGRVPATGAQASFQPADDGLTLLVVLAYRRSGLADPYEVRLELPEGVTLTPEQYEFLLNVVERAVPAGIEINTYELRRQHVDLTGDGTAQPLPPDLARTYRRFRISPRRTP